MIRYTSDPVDNVKLFLKTYAIPDKSFNFMSDATLSGANPEIEKQPGVAPYTALRLPEWDPYKVMQNSYVGPFKNSELIDKGEGLIETPYQTELQKSNIAAENPERLKQITLIRQELDRLDKEEAKYNQERQAKRDYYNSDAFLAKVYSLDPKTAEFLAGRRDQQTNIALEESKIEANRYNKSAVYTPEQKRLIDAKEQNRLEMQNVSKSVRTAKIHQDKLEYERWSKAYEALKNRDIELTKALAATGLTGYDIDDTDYTKFEGDNDTNPNPAASGVEKSNYEKAKDIVNKSLAIDNQGYTTNDNKRKANQALKDYNADLGDFPLKENELAALENIIKNANVRPPAATRPKTSNPEASKLAFNSLGEVIKWSEASKLDPNNEADRLLLAKMKSRSYANESYMSDDANLSGSAIRQFFGNLTNVQTIPVEDAVKYKKEIPGNYRRAVDMALVFTDKKYIDRISETLADNIKNTIDNYPLHGSSSTNNPAGTTKNTQAKTRKVGKFTVVEEQ